MEVIVRKGQRIRLRVSSRTAQDWNIPHEVEGTVICQYRLFASKRGEPDRLDVRFGPTMVVWGIPATEFEVTEAQ